ncbi:MAG: tripartite tricarboxylate transporter substrate binding protein [Rhizobiales bacterium]|jgi:tripartite-type tricarboxylate transporter receptor subunit TctC|nr:tripartite tricarboxylate transporter substrate binding protein [Hyphomicrobiales bacterium]
MKKYILAIALCPIFAAGAAHAQAYPTHPVTIIVPYPAGGPTDQVTRQIASKLSAKFGQQFIIENISGGGTNIAGQRVARSAPDGYTLFVHNLQISANVSLYKSLPFDTEKDFTPIAMLNSNPLVLVGRKALPAKTLPELAAWMKSSPTPAKMGHPGVGATGHLAAFLLAQAMGVKIDNIPYRGAAPMLQDILGGHIDLFFATPQQVVGQFRSGDIKVFGITSKEPSPLFPGVESFVKAYGPKLDIAFWQMMLAPAGTPKPIITALDTALQEALADPEILKVWAASGMSPYPKAQRTPEGAAAYLKSEIKRWGDVIRDNHIEASTQ